MFERLFGNRTADPALAGRIPPGQYLTEKFPVLHYGSVPKANLSTWEPPRLGRGGQSVRPELGGVPGAAANAR